MYRLLAVVLTLTMVVVESFVNLSNLHSGRKLLGWTAQQTSSTLQYRNLGNTALVNEYIHVQTSKINNIVIQSDATTAKGPPSSKDMLIPYTTQGYTSNGYTCSSNDRIVQLQSVIHSMQSQIKQLNVMHIKEKARMEQIMREKEELRFALDFQEKEYADSMVVLLGRYEALELRFENEKHKVVPESLGSKLSVAIVRQNNDCVAQGDQGRVLARQALEEGRVQSHRITMSFNQRLRFKDQEIRCLKEQLAVKRLQQSTIMNKEARPGSPTQSAFILRRINQMAQVMINYAQLHSNAPTRTRKTVPERN
jgi:hypothetical protein